MIKIDRPNIEDAPRWCPYYFNLIAEDNLMEALLNNKKNTIDLISSIPFSREDFAYAENKWSVKMIFIHLIDTERFYSYRAFSSSRQVDIELEFVQDVYAKNCNAANRTLRDIAEEFLALRDHTISLFSNMTTEMLDFKGFPNKVIYTARSLGWMVAGHNIHHCKIIKEKYLF
jgi:hypothetical protein